MHARCTLCGIVRALATLQLNMLLVLISFLLSQGKVGGCEWHQVSDAMCINS